MKKLKFLLLITSSVSLAVADPLAGAPVGANNWNKVRLYGHSYNVNGYTNADYRFIKSNFWLSTIEKRHAWLDYGSQTTEISTRQTSAKIIARYPTARTLFYWNCDLVYDDLYESLADIHTTNPTWVKPTRFNIEGVENSFNFSEAGMRNYWVNKASAQVKNSTFSGIFVDAIPKAIANGQLEYVHEMMDRLPGMVIYNGYRYHPGTGAIWGGPETLKHADGVFVESFLNSVINHEDKAVALIDALLEIPDHKYIICNGVADGWGSNGSHEFSLAGYLIVANKRSFYRFGEGHDFNSKYMTYWHEDFEKDLGAPKGNAKKNGYTYTRSFEHADVVIDLKAKTSKITWK